MTRWLGIYPNPRFLDAMQMREAAERVLFAQTLDEKLQLSAPELADDLPGEAVRTPDGPGRPQELQIVEKGVRAGFPGINKLDDDRERGRMLHFLANHELLAAELMALVLLKFPDAPKAYRAGVYEAMREEQMHTLMYLRRMKDCGVHFGELPLNNYFWRLIAPMETPMDFVTRLNLTFEQANLDFSKYYASRFREAGDPATAGVLEKIYQDEIGHVGHGVKWFRRWKDQKDNDWKAFNKALVFPFSASKAKGLAPFNAEGRRLAGLDEDFISHLEVFEQSRGRTPVVHWFNPHAEREVAARRRGETFRAKKHSAAIELDAEMVMLAWSRQDDVTLMRRPPSKEHLAYLKQAGFQIPEIVRDGELDDRKLGGLRPWAWSPEICEQLSSYRPQVPPTAKWPWRPTLPDHWFSKEIGVRLLEHLGIDERPVVGENLDHALGIIDEMLKGGPVMIKGAYGCSGLDQQRVTPTDIDTARGWLERILPKHGKVVIEPWRERVADFSVLYEMDAERVQLVGMTTMENDSRGRFVASRVAPKWGSMLDNDVATYLFREAKLMSWYQKRIPEALRELLPGYVGPLGIDAMVFRQPDGKLGWLPVVELNVRMTMGRVAVELMAKSRPGTKGTLRFEKLADTDPSVWRAGTLDGGKVLLNDPTHARNHLITWEVQTKDPT